MSALLKVLLGFCILLVQISLGYYGSFFGVTPDIFLAYIMFILFYGERDEVLIPVVMLGFMRDLFSGGMPCINALLITFIALLVLRERRRMYVDHVLSQILLSFLAVGLINAVSLLLEYYPNSQGGFWGHFGHLFLATFYTSLCTPLLFRALKPFRFPLGLYQKPSFN